MLILTYYWIPSGGSGVQRWLKFVKYLRDCGWEPVIYSAENGEYPMLDASLEKDVPENVAVIRRPIWEPYQLYKRFVGQNKDERVVLGTLNETAKTGVSSNIATWIRGNFFIPDARMFWIRPSAKFLNEYLKDSPVDAIVSTGPPHTMHRIAARVAQKHNLPWLADFRDPWTQIDFYHELYLTPIADAIHRHMEKSTLQRADRVVVVGNTMADEFAKIHLRHYDVITNGFDSENLPQHPQTPDSKRFTIAHIGLMNKDRNHPYFWETLAKLKQNHAGFGKHQIGRAHV